MFALLSTLTSASVDDYCGHHGPIDLEEKTIAGFKLDAVQIVFRHGARTSLQDIACFGDSADYQCPQESTFSLTGDARGAILKRFELSCERGQLLPGAREQISRLAKWIQNTYPDKVSNHTELTFRSTDQQRTLASMYHLKSKLFPGLSNLEVAVSDYSDDALAGNRIDEEISVLIEEYASSQAHLDVIGSRQYRECQDLWEKTIKTKFTPYAMDCLASSYCADVPLPRGLKYPKELLECVFKTELDDRKVYFGKTDSTFKQKALKLASMRIQPVIDEIDSKLRSGKSGFLAAHDASIVLILQGLGGLWDGVWPKYAELVTFERHVNARGDKALLRIVRNGIPITTQPFDKFENDLLLA